MSDEEVHLGFGEPIYDADGRRLGTIRGFDEHGFYVSTEEGIHGMSIEHLRSGHELGEAELMWRCWNCGEMGDIEDDLPEACPSCDAPREDLYYYQED
ncbi:MAG: rubredoxin-like domain-containing protein [Haloarculaceae archaeon]